MKNSKQPIYVTLETSKLRLAEYQRSPELSRIKRIMQNFDPSKLGALKVSFRDGMYWAFDGQHRLMACKSLGIIHVMCEVHEGLSYEDEARLFYTQSENQKKISIGEKFKGRVEAKDVKALDLKRIVESCGFKLLYAGGKSHYKISAIGTLEKIERIHSKLNLVTTLDLINKTWKGSPESTDARMLMGVSLFVKNNEDFKEKTFVTKLSKVEPYVIMRKGDSDLTNGEYKPYAIVIKDYYEKGNRKHKEDKELYQIRIIED